MNLAARTFLQTAFPILILAILFLSYTPNSKKPHPHFLGNLLNPKVEARLFAAPTWQVFRSKLPETEAVSIVMDQPLDVKVPERQYAWDLQNYICPTLVNPEPVEHFAVVYCSNQAVAEKRLRETGYKWLHAFSGGKGIAVKAL